MLKQIEYKLYGKIIKINYHVSIISVGKNWKLTEIK